MEFYLFVLWMLLSALSAWVWSQRGKSGVAGFLVALIFSPVVGLLVGVMLTPNVERVEERRAAREGLRKCPFCAELIKREAVVCKHCSRTVEPPQSPPSLEKALARAGGRIPAGEACSFCGVVNTLKIAVPRCSRCGS